MATLAEIRQQYPQYEDMSDKQLADALYGKFYSDMDRGEFDQKVGLRPDWAWKGSIGGAAYELANWGADDPNYQPSAVPWLDPINSFANQAVESIPVAGPFLRDVGHHVDAAFNNALGFPEQTAEDRAAINAGVQGRFPAAALAGQVAGTVTPLAGLATTQLGGQLLGTAGNIGQQILMGGISGGTIGFSDMKVRGADTDDALMWGALGGGVGGAIAPVLGHAISPVARALFGQSGSDGARMLAPALKSDGITSTDDIARLLMDSPDLRIADLGKNVQGQAAALAARPGDASNIVADALFARQQGGNARIRAASADILGPNVSPMQLNEQLAQGRKALSPMYAETLSEAPPVSIGGISTNIDSALAPEAFGGEGARALNRIQNMLTNGGEGLITDPRALLNVRHEIDAMLYPPGLGAKADPNVTRVLGPVRVQIDDELARVSPGIKEIDAQYSELARQAEAYEVGQHILDTGRDTIARPDAMASMMDNASPTTGMGPSAAPFRLSQGGVDEINRIIGTSGNDRVALARILKGDGSWNHERLVSTFGQEKADALSAVLAREQMMAQTENFALNGSRTSPLQSAQEVLFGGEKSGVVQQAMNMDFGDAAAKAVDTVAGGYFQAQRQKALAELAELLMSGQGNTKAREDIAKALMQHQQSIFPPASVPVLLMPEPEREPLRIVVQRDR